MTLSRYWHPIARAEDVGDQPRQFTLLDQPIVAFRVDQGVAAFKDLCIHRGTALSLGWIEEGRLTCAYHGWQYDRTGACVHIPSLPPGSTIPRKARAVAYQAVEAYGLVWIAMEDPVAPIPSWPGDEWNDPDYHGFFSTHYIWKTSAGRAIENFLDFTHFPFVHPGLLGSRNQTVMDPHDVIETDWGFRYALEQEEPRDLGSHVGMLEARPGDAIRYEWYLHLPFTAHHKKVTLSTGEVRLVTLVCAPTAPKRTDMYLFIFRNHSLEEDDLKFKKFVDEVMHQDRSIVESQRPEEIPTDLRDELHLKVPDSAGIVYRRLLGGIGGAEPFMP